MTFNLVDLPSLERAKVSFEFFPPRTEEMELALWRCIAKLKPLKPEFVSVTYGAGGSTRDRTHNTVKRIQHETGLQAAAHLTCVAATRRDVDEVIRGYWDAGIRHIVALRGDPPEGVGHKYQPHPGGYATSADLIEGIRKIGDFEISVSAYPEKHPDSPSIEEDLDMLRRKVAAGARRAITQFVFDTEKIVRYRDLVAEAGIDVPIIPGIMPVRSFKGLLRFAKGCGASIPPWLSHLYQGLDKDAVTHQQMSAIVAAEQCLTLREYGFDQFHFYTLNQPELTLAICHLLNVRPPLAEPSD